MQSNKCKKMIYLIIPKAPIHLKWRCFFFNDTASTEIYTTEDTLSLHVALPISPPSIPPCASSPIISVMDRWCCCARRSEEHTSELQSPSVISYAVFCLKKK